MLRAKDSFSKQDQLPWGGWERWSLPMGELDRVAWVSGD